MTGSTATDSTDTEASTALDREELFDLLGDDRRRRVLEYLLEVEAVGVEALAEAVARREFDEPSTDDRRRVATTLVHSHLPRLEAAGVVEYDREEGRVAPTSRLRSFEPYLGSTPDDGSPALPTKAALAGFAGGSLATYLVVQTAGAASVLGLATAAALSAWRHDP